MLNTERRVNMCEENKVDVPSYIEFSEMDRVENDPDDVAEILEICEGE